MTQPFARGTSPHWGSSRIEFSNCSARQFKKIKDEKLKERITAALEYIGKEPLAGKPLQAQLKGDRPLGVGEYRIIYHFYKEKSFIGILRIEHRRSAYR